MRKLTIAVDFDNCITVGTNYPEIGRLRTGAKETINKWALAGHTVIINTCRAGESLQEAGFFLCNHGIKFHYINENTRERITEYNTDTRKISADLYFDDRSTAPDWSVFDAMVERHQKPTIICIVGESGSGKTLSAEYIAKQWRINLIQSRTTRPKRTPDENGHTFATDAEFDSYDRGEVIAFTKFGDYRYCCLRQDVTDRNTYVIDEDGLKYIKQNFSDEFNIFSIRLYRPDLMRELSVGTDRIKRDQGRFNMQPNEFDYVILSMNSKELLYNRLDAVISQNMLYI